jgi:hypothetical protein
MRTWHVGHEADAGSVERRHEGGVVVRQARGKAHKMGRGATDCQGPRRAQLRVDVQGRHEELHVAMGHAVHESGRRGRTGPRGRRAHGASNRNARRSTAREEDGSAPFTVKGQDAEGRRPAEVPGVEGEPERTRVVERLAEALRVSRPGRDIQGLEHGLKIPQRDRKRRQGAAGHPGSIGSKRLWKPGGLSARRHTSKTATAEEQHYWPFCWAPGQRNPGPGRATASCARAHCVPLSKAHRPRAGVLES